MKIGILTLPLHTNYGGILQAYALQTVLERMGHEVVVFDTPNKSSLPPLWKLPACFAKRTIWKLIGKADRIFIEHYYNTIRPVITKNIQIFVDSYMHRMVIRSFKELHAKDFDAIVVGSDQVWRLSYFCNGWGKTSIENAYLSFAKRWKTKRIAYAASFGTDIWEYNVRQTNECKKLLQLFDAVSVREEGGKSLCKLYLDVIAQHVLDPTLLLGQEDYISLFAKSNTPQSKGTLLYYVLDETEELKNIIRKVAEQKKMVPFVVNNPLEYDDSKTLQERIKPSVETWLRGFYDAEFVITDSFHACAFSIIFKKQFVVFGNKKRGMSRFESLLKMFGLEDRLVDKETNINFLKDIDYSSVYIKYNHIKDNSLSFLAKSLYTL